MKFSISVGPAFDTLVIDVCALLEETGINATDVNTLAYPNAIHLIANLSIRHDAKQRKITKKESFEAASN